MNNREFLAKHTFSEEGFTIGRRVYETLMQDASSAGPRTAKLLGLLMDCLERKELLDASEIDDMLLDII
ncbi:hypothetical protein [uncultured Pseudacidovorax sp.]|uniref:hypothetical protein n=1 Tax=uncultured Pseudacidovorax sp. TaxID=679313 RepID=UPI0025FD0463|nr:hypothetical protein [uncultured Pseudacidovorax sp.]